MYDTTTFLQSELAYRTERIKANVGRGGKRHERVRRGRRPVRTTDAVR